jgi:hypothetical protein
VTLTDLNDEELLEVANSIMNNLMEASTHLDYAGHVRDFSDRAKASLDEAQFKRVCEQYQRERGYFAGRDLLGILRRPQSVVVVWRQRFTKAEGEYLAELFLSGAGGRPQVERVMVA